MPFSSYIQRAKNRFKKYLREANAKTLFAERSKPSRGSNQSYTRYLILSHQRSGSSLIVSSLRAHSQILAYGELFKGGKVGFNTSTYENHDRELKAARDAFPVIFIERCIFIPYKDDFRAVGFKLFPDQIDNKHFNCVWDWLDRNQDIRIVLLFRRNLLETYTSLLIAEQTRTWGIKDEAQRPSTTLTINPGICHKFFEKRDRYNSLSRNHAAKHPHMEIIYEDLAANPSECLLKIQNFIGVESETPQLKSIKKEVRRPSEIILNYEELKMYFSGTKWSYCFAED